MDAILALCTARYFPMRNGPGQRQSIGESHAARVEKEKASGASFERKGRISHAFDENGVEITRKAIRQDIHKFSHIPCAADRKSFGGNVSGCCDGISSCSVWKGMQKSKPGNTEGTEKRLRIFMNFLNTFRIHIDPSWNCTVFRTRAMPKNLLEITDCF